MISCAGFCEGESVPGILDAVFTAWEINIGAIAVYFLASFAHQSFIRFLCNELQVISKKERNERDWYRKEAKKEITPRGVWSGAMGHKGQIRRKYAPPPLSIPLIRFQIVCFYPWWKKNLSWKHRGRRQTQSLFSYIDKIYCPLLSVMPQERKKIQVGGSDFVCYVPVTIPLGVMCQLGRNGPIFSHDGQIKRGSTLEEH